MLKYVASILIVFSTIVSAHAHSPLKMSLPAKDGTHIAPIENIELTFGKSARLTKLTVTNDEDEATEIDLSEHKEFDLKHMINISPLSAGSYTIFWRALSKDGHPIRGEIPFKAQ